jgi:hypothetical protein
MTDKNYEYTIGEIYQVPSHCKGGPLQPHLLSRFQKKLFQRRADGTLTPEENRHFVVIL